MGKTVLNFSNSIVGIRLGTVSIGVIDTIKVIYHGQSTPIKHLASVGKLQTSIFVDPYDPEIIGPVCNALKENGFNAYIFSKTRVVISIPPASGEEKNKIYKHLTKLAEESRVAIRTIRKNFRQKNKDIDDKELQLITDNYINEIEVILARKINSL